MKKWITSGVFSDYLTTAVRTGGDGMGGISMMVIDTKTPGVNMKKMKCQGMSTSATSFIILENVRVPI